MKKYLFAFLAMVCMLLSLTAFAAEDIVWDFDDNTTQSWSVSNVASHSVEDGVLKLDLATNTGDVMLQQAVNVSTKAYRYIVIDMKHNVPDGSMGTHPLEVFFKLSGGSFKQSHSVGAELVSASDTYNSYVVDLGSNSYYTGTLAALRIDPIDTMSSFDATYTVEIDKITFLAEEYPGTIEWNFDNGDAEGWSVKNGTDKGITDGVYKVALSYTSSDTWIQNYSVSFDAASYKYMVVYMRHNLPESAYGSDKFMALFTRTTDKPWQAHLLASTDTRYGADEGFMPYIVDMTKCTNWNGSINALRVDPFEAVSASNAEYYFEIDKILMSYDVTLTLEDTEYTVPAGVTVTLSDYDAPTKDGFAFAGWTNGESDEIITKIAIEEDTVLTAKWVEANPEWNFDDNTTQGWQSSVSGTLSAENGALNVLLHNTNNDVYVYISNQSIDTSVYKYAVVYMKHNVPESAWDSTPFQFLFYNTNSSWWANMLVNTDRKPASDNYEEYIFNMGSNKYWSGIIPRLRFDPFQITAPTLGDYVAYVDKIVMCPEIKLTLDYGFDDMVNSTYAIPGGIAHSLAGYDEPEYEGYRFLGYTDVDGKAVTSVNSVGNTTVYASWKATSPSITLTDKYAAVANIESDAVFVLSGYDIYGRITDTVTKKVSSDYSVSIADSGLDISKVKTVKAFLFDDMTTLTPLCKEKSTLLYTFDYAELEGEEYGFVGRWFDYEHSDGNTYKATITPGAEMYFKVSGTAKVDFKLNCNDNLHDVPYIAVSVDGCAPTRISTHRTNAKTIVSGLDPDKEHVIRIVVDSFSSAQGTRWTEGNGLIFDKVIVDEGGTITGIMPNNPIIAYYGDSITEGLAALSTEGQGMYTTSSSAINAYPFTASHLLGAVSHTNGYGSTGITIEKGLGNVPNCITVIDNMIKDTPIVMPELDAIVLNHGHNDLNASVSEEDFAVGYKEVLVRLREKHPGVPIFAVVPYAQRYVDVIKNVVEELDDDLIYYVPTADWEYTTTDGVHPDAAGGEKLGTRLAEVIGKVLGIGGYKAE